MNQEEIKQAVHEEKWVPKADRVKISTTNMRIDPSMTQKEETYQVVLDIIKNNTFFKAFLAFADVPKIYMQHQALDICPRVPGKEFIVPPFEEELLHFLIGLRYKGALTWSQGKKATVSLKPASVEESDESDSEPAKKRTGNRRVIKKKVSISIDDNIISEPDVPLELGKSMSLIEATKEEAARQVHATPERIMTESDPEPARRRPSEQLAADTMQALKASRKSTRSQLHAGGSSKGTGTKPKVPDESTNTPTTLSEGIGTNPGVPNEEKDTSTAKADVTLDWGSENKSDYSEEDQGNDEDTLWEYTDEDEEKKDDND
ncbi:hypothetical protein Tco_1302016 [Tanacetum coccineum]